MLAEARALLSGFKDKHILVVGDLMLDEYIWGKVERISPEAPVIVVDVESSELRPGGGANVANNLRALGAAVSISGIVGEDEAGRALISLLNESAIDVTAVLADSSRPTTKKTRVIAHNQQVARVDHESREHLSERMRSTLWRAVESQVADCDAVLLSDYDKGVMTRDIVARCVAVAAAQGLTVTANPKPANLRHFRGATVVMLNQSEAVAAAHDRLRTLEDVARAGKRFVADLDVKAVIVTCGAQGLVVCPADADPTPLPAVPIEVYDVAGAGDTVISVLTLAMACGADLLTAARLANCAGGAAVQKVGVSTVSQQEILAVLRRARPAR